MVNTSGQKQKLIYEPRLTVTKQHRTHSTIFALLIGCSSLLGATTVSAEDINGLSYTLNSPNDGEATVTGRASGNASTIIDIPEQVLSEDGLNYNVKLIGFLAFSENGLTAVNIPSNVEIAQSAFSNNDLTSVTFKPYANLDESFCIDNSSGIAYFVVCPSTTIIGLFAFINNSLETVTLPGGLKSIGDFAFFNNKLTKMTIPYSVERIGRLAFVDNNIAELTFEAGNSQSNKLTLIEEYAFRGNSIKSLAIPINVERIGVDAFKDNELDTLTFETESKLSTISNGAFQNNKLTSVAIPTNVTEIHTKAFYNNVLEEVIFGEHTNGIDSLVSIGSSAFAKNFLKTVRISPGVTTIGISAFADNILASVDFAGTHTTPDDGLNQPYVTDYKITTIKDKAFSGNQLGNITIPNSVEYIGEDAFNHNPLDDVHFRGDYPGDGFDEKMFGENTHGGVKYINVCQDKNNWEDVKFLSGESNNRTALVSVTSINCNLSYAVMPSGASAGVSMPSDRRGRLIDADIVIPDEVTISGVTYPVTNVSFLYQNHFGSVILGNQVTTIGDYALAENHLTEVIIPASVTNIESLAFSSNKLTSVKFFGNNPGSNSILPDSFSDNPDLTTINACEGSEGWDGISFNNGTSDIAVTLVSCDILVDGLLYEVVEAQNPFKYYEQNLASAIQGCVDCHSSSKGTLGALESNANEKNYTVFSEYIEAGNGERLLSKVRGESHSGGVQFALGSNEYEALSEFLELETNNTASATVLGRATGSDETDIVIPDTITWDDKTYPVTGIAQDAFFQNPITSVTIGDNVLDIGDNAFTTTLLTSVTFGNSVTTIGAGAFYQFMEGGGLTSVNLPDSLIGIGDSAFCVQKLTSVTLPASVMNIGNSAFCQITSVSFLGDYSTFFSDAAFEGNPELSVEACFDSASWNDISFKSGQKDVKVTLCAEVYISRISNAAENNNVTNLTINDLTAIVGLENIESDNVEAYFAAISDSNGEDVDTLAEIQTLVDDVNNSTSGLPLWLIKVAKDAEAAKVNL
jgi:hypothetical protein